MRKLMCITLLFAVSMFAGLGSLFSQETIGLQYDHLFYAYFRGMGITPNDEAINSYIQNINSNEYQRFRNNEFEWRRLRQEGERNLIAGIQNMDFNTIFTTVSMARFGNYDFDKEGFSFNIRNTLQVQVLNGNNWLWFTIIVTNIRDYNLLRMNSSEASRFIEQRTIHGEVNRNVLLNIHFRFSDFSNNEFASIANDNLYANGGRNRYLHGRIVHIDVYNEDGTVKIGEITN